MAQVIARLSWEPSLDRACEISDRDDKPIFVDFFHPT